MEPPSRNWAANATVDRHVSSKVPSLARVPWTPMPRQPPGNSKCVAAIDWDLTSLAGLAAVREFREASSAPDKEAKSRPSGAQNTARPPRSAASQPGPKPRAAARRACAARLDDVVPDVVPVPPAPGGAAESSQSASDVSEDEDCSARRRAAAAAAALGAVSGFGFAFVVGLCRRGGGNASSSSSSKAASAASSAAFRARFEHFIPECIDTSLAAFKGFSTTLARGASSRAAPAGSARVRRAVGKSSVGA
mmetsp:Transcript_25760/g.88541  ORF Transcript_25760/g.88541 Transcript_25760/m.88541 type:complete len:250 (+) Transcript_25760:1867-2616(+)